MARGANALTYGASTLGGAIDVVSPTARDSAPLAVFLDGGSFGTLNGRATLGGVRGELDGLVTIEGRSFEGYRDHSDQERWGIYANAGWRPSSATRLQLFATYVHNDLRLPGALARSEAEADPDQASAAALRNLLGEDYIATLGVMNEAARDARVLYPGAPRSAFFGVRVAFQPRPEAHNATRRPPTPGPAPVARSVKGVCVPQRERTFRLEMTPACPRGTAS